MQRCKIMDDSRKDLAQSRSESNVKEARQHVL